MAAITVIRGGTGSFVHVLHQNIADDQYTLDILRLELVAARIMSAPDSFMSSDASINGVDEPHIYLGDIFLEEKQTSINKESGKPEEKTVKTRKINLKVGVASERMISVTRQNEPSVSTIFEVTKKLTELRTHLMAIAAMTDDDLFSRKQDARDTVRKTEEGTLEVSAILGEKDTIAVVSGSPSRMISVVKGDKKTSYRIGDDKTLVDLRTILVAAKVMETDDLFTLDTGDVAKESEGTVKVTDLKDKTVTIKYDPLIGGNTIPKPVVPTMPSGKVEWSQPITYTAGSGASAPPKVSGMGFDGNEEDNWPMLTWDQKRYIYNLLQLGRAIVIGPRGTATKGKEVQRSFESAVQLIYSKENGPLSLVSDVAFRSRFLSTFSLEAQELHRKTLTTASAGAGVKGMAFTSEVNVAFESAEHTLRSRLYTSQMFCKPVVTLKTDILKDVKPNPAFSLAIWEALTAPGQNIHRYEKLLDVLVKYGQYLPTVFQLGGAIFWEESYLIDKSKKIVMNSFSTQSGLETTIKGVEIKAGGGHSDAKKNENEDQLEERTKDFFVIGGAAESASDTDPSNWLKSLKKHGYWKVIQYDELVPTIRFLDPKLLQPCLALIKEYAADHVTAEKTYLDMMRYALIAEAVLPGEDLFD